MIYVYTHVHAITIYEEISHEFERDQRRVYEKVYRKEMETGNVVVIQ